MQQWGCQKSTKNSLQQIVSLYTIYHDKPRELCIIINISKGAAGDISRGAFCFQKVSN